MESPYLQICVYYADAIMCASPRNSELLKSIMWKTPVTNSTKRGQVIMTAMSKFMCVFQQSMAFILSSLTKFIFQELGGERANVKTVVLGNRI